MGAQKTLGSGTVRSRSLVYSGVRQAPPGDERAVVVLTGFGPFPGVERNASAKLASRLARMATERHQHVRFVAEVLPVDWALAPMLIAELIGQYRPAVSLNFGVSARASGFVIEAHAYNETLAAPDGRGLIAASAELVSGDRPRRSATLPVRRIVHDLQRAGIPAQLSSDPGRYLCNAVLYHSLRQAIRATPRLRTGFVHVPATLEPGVRGEAAEMGWPEALEGGQRLIDICLMPLRLKD